ncbi:MAG: alpha/beta fold hydrolase, partial [Balneolales bacterium]
MEPQRKKLLDFKLKEFPQPEYYPLKYPVLLCHGFGAVVSMILPSPLHHTCMFMREHGIVAFAPNIAPYVKLEVGSAAWARIIGKVLKMTGSPKINVIAHSMGGLSLRHAIHTLDLSEIVSSLTTVSSPHHGTSLAEMALETPKTALEAFIKLSDRMGNAIYPEIQSDVTGAMHQLTRSYMAEFNEKVPDSPEVSYYSISAATGKETDSSIGVLLSFYNRYIYGREGANDGFVSEKSAHWGEHIGCVKLSHLEQVKISLSKSQISEWENLWLEII